MMQLHAQAAHAFAFPNCTVIFKYLGAHSLNLDAELHRLAKPVTATADTVSEILGVYQQVSNRLVDKHPRVTAGFY